MSSEFLKRAFLPFEQERISGEASQSGTGLGLSIVKKLVELLGGTIEIKSQISKGTEIVLNFTTELVDAVRTDIPDISPYDETVLSGSRILVCEDHPLNSEIVCKLLMKKNITVEVAANGKISLDKFKDSAEFYYDAILMDIRMPVMDGLMTAAAIRNLERADAKTVPIIAMTANAFDDDVQKSINAGMNAHLSKPVDPQKLYTALSAALSRRKEM